MSDVHFLPPDLTPEDNPWWWYRCIHRGHDYHLIEGKEYGCWRVLREAEGVVILQLICLAQFHILVDLPGTGSVCKTLQPEQFNPVFDDEPALLRLVQGQWKELKQLYPKNLE